MAPKVRDRKQKRSELQPPTAVGTPSEVVDRNSPIFFHKEWEDFGFMSNFYAAPFTAPDPAIWLPSPVAQLSSTAPPGPGRDDTAPTLITFQHSEQYYMYCKALFFGDGDAARWILDAASPAVCKAIGRSVKDFDEEVWAKQDLNVRVMEEALW